MLKSSQRFEAATKPNQLESFSVRHEVDPSHPDLTGQCRSWLAAEQDDDTARLGTSVLDRLAAVAGGADSVAGYCTALVGPARAGDQPGVPTPRPRPSKTPGPPGSEGPPAAPSDGAHPESQGEQG